MDVDARLKALEQENEMLRDRIAQLESALMGDAPLPIEFRLTGSEAAVLGVLMQRELATKDAVMAALYRDHGKDEREIRVVDGFMCKLRKKLSPFGITIVTRWGEGYALPAASKAIIREMRDAARVAA